MRTLAAALLPTLLLVGCISHWETQVATPSTAVQVSSAHEFRITRSDGPRVTLFEPAVVGDSLVGKQSPVPAWPDTATRIAVALKDIKAIEAKEPDIVASVAVGTAVTFVGFLVLFRATGLPSGD